MKQNIVLIFLFYYSESKQKPEKLSARFIHKAIAKLELWDQQSLFQISSPLGAWKCNFPHCQTDGSTNQPTNLFKTFRYEVSLKPTSSLKSKFPLSLPNFFVPSIFLLFVCHTSSMVRICNIQSSPYLNRILLIILLTNYYMYIGRIFFVNLTLLRAFEWTLGK